MHCENYGGKRGKITLVMAALTFMLCVCNALYENYDLIKDISTLTMQHNAPIMQSMHVYEFRESM